ncbi:MAG: PH domain-containing protein [Nanoarchaeota archaeon]|nr:PH domain-containing protein [Nanoarchaeota archaeon]
MNQQMSAKIIIKPNLFSSLFLEFLKQVLVNFFFFLPLLIIYLIVEFFFELTFQSEAIFLLIGLTLLFSFFKISSRLITLLNTKYVFTPSSIEKQTGIISKSSHSLHYSQITDIELSVELWDRICGVGDLVIHTANDRYSNSVSKHSMILQNVKKPQQLKDSILKKVSPHKDYSHSHYPTHNQQPSHNHHH